MLLGRFRSIFARPWAAVQHRAAEDAQAAALLSALHPNKTLHTYGHYLSIKKRPHAPSCIIAAGAAAITKATALKQQYDVPLIGLLHPGDAAKSCDALLLPAHEPVPDDAIQHHTPLLRTHGVLTHYGESYVAQQAKLPDMQMQMQAIKALPTPCHAVLLGGVHVGGTVTIKDAKHMVQQARARGAQSLCISNSKRTQTGLLQALETWLKAEQIPHIIYDMHANHDDTNPYDLWLHKADAIWVTADSLRMVSETMSAHHKVHIYCQAALAPHYAAFAAHIQPLTLPLAEAARAALWLKKNLANR